MPDQKATKIQIDSEQLAALLSRIALGDQSAFKQYYEATSGIAYSLALKMMGNAPSAQDLIQESYIKVWAKSVDFQPSRGNALSWLLGIVRYRALDLLRANKRRDNVMGSHQAEMDTKDLMASPQANDDSLILCLDGLASTQRESILQTFVYGWTYQELADQLRKPIGTVKSRIRRGLALLKECMER